MKYHAALIAACFAIAGFAWPAMASPGAGDIGAQTAARRDAIQLAAAKTARPGRGGVSTTTGDVDGDGTADVVTTAPPKPKHKPVRRVRRHR